MAYTPINWQTGDTITAEKMNKMDNGWDASSVALTSESVTTETGIADAYGVLTYSTPITADTITVTFNGTPYVCDAFVEGSDYVYGDYDFVSTPFYIFSNSEENGLGTPEAGTYSIEISESSIEVSSQFVGAVNASIPELIPPFKLVPDETTLSEFNDARAQRRFCYLWDGTLQYVVYALNIPSAGKTPLTVYPTPQNGSFAFDSNDILRFYDE